jgi:glyoxylase-like metal-dependent hydrolase (beta-lactamase superfamily II)
MAKIFPLSEGIFTVGHDKQFVPFDLETDELTERPTGSLLVEIQPFLVITDKDTIVLDTGLGFKNADGELQIHANIRKCGVDPGSVTKVLLSHLHKDHAGGLVYKTSEGILKTVFEHATYYIYRPEAEIALTAGYPSYILPDIEPLLSSAQVHWLDGEEGVIDDYIRFVHTGGHSKEHIVFIINDAEGNIFFGGDEAPQLKQMKIKYVAKYDYDGKNAMNIRSRFAEQGHKEGWRFLFYHDVKIPIATL